jgi:hypothetical protein
LIYWLQLDIFRGIRYGLWYKALINYARKKFLERCRR